MADLPSGTLYGTVVGQFLKAVADSITDVNRDPDSLPMQGTITFTPQVSKIRLDVPGLTNPVTVFPQPIVGMLSPSGYLIGQDGQAGVRLIASDSPGRPTNFTYTVTFEFEGAAPFSTEIFVSSNQTIDLTTVLPVPEDAGYETARWREILDKVYAAAASVQETIDTFKRGSVFPLTIEEFGIRSDGLGNGNADGFEAMIAAAMAARRREIKVPSGRYRMTRQVNVRITDNTKWSPGIRIIGEGMSFARDGSIYGTVFEPISGMTGAVFSIQGTPSTDNSNRGQINGVLLEDFGIRGNSGVLCNGIELAYYTNATIRRVMVSDCVSAVKILRQANGATFGYANQTVIDQLFAVANRGWGIDAGTAGALCGALIQACNLSENLLGGIKITPGPSTLQGNIYTGNKGPALLIVKPTGDSNATGPTMVGEHFETNGLASSTPYASGSAQVVIEYAQSPRFMGCNWLGSGNGENDLMAGHVDDVTGLYMAGNSHFGKSGVPSQATIVAGPKLLRARIDDTEVFGYGGTTSRATSAQKYKSTTTNAQTYAHLSAGSVIDGAVSVVPNTATVVLENVMLPVGAAVEFEIASQGGSVWATGIVRRSRDGNSITVTQSGGSSDCTLSIVSGALRVTQTTATNPLLMFWSGSILRTI